MPLFKCHERLKAVFEHQAERLARRFGVSYGHASKWMRDCDDFGTGTPNPLQRVRDLIDEAIVVDPTGVGAAMLAQDAPEYLDELMSRRAPRGHWSPAVEALQLLKEADDVIQRLGRVDLLNLHPEQLRPLYSEVVQLGVMTERVKGLVLQAMRSCETSTLSGIGSPGKGGGR